MDQLIFSYDAERDVMKIEGMKYSGDLFRAFAEGGLILYTPFDFIKRSDGVVTIRRLTAPKSDQLHYGLRWHIGNILLNFGNWLLYKEDET